MVTSEMLEGRDSRGFAEYQHLVYWTLLRCLCEEEEHDLGLVFPEKGSKSIKIEKISKFGHKGLFIYINVDNGLPLITIDTTNETVSFWSENISKCKINLGQGSSEFLEEYYIPKRYGITLDD